MRQKACQIPAWLLPLQGLPPSSSALLRTDMPSVHQNAAWSGAAGGGLSLLRTTHRLTRASQGKEASPTTHPGAAASYEKWGARQHRCGSDDGDRKEPSSSSTTSSSWKHNVDPVLLTQQPRCASIEVQPYCVGNSTPARRGLSFLGQQLLQRGHAVLALCP